MFTDVAEVVAGIRTVMVNVPLSPPFIAPTLHTMSVLVPTVGAVHTLALAPPSDSKVAVTPSDPLGMGRLSTTPVAGVLPATFW